MVDFVDLVIAQVVMLCFVEEGMPRPQTIHPHLRGQEVRHPNLPY